MAYFFAKFVVPILTSGGCEDYISAESLVERIHGLPVKSIEFITEEDQRKDGLKQSASSDTESAEVES